jgi:hypothetical protein
MTLPDERYRAIKQAEQLMHDLCDRTKTPRVPLAIRHRALGVLRHYPNQWDLNRLSAAAPEVIVERMDDLHRMVAGYESTVDKGQE